VAFLSQGQTNTGIQITDNGRFHEHITERINKASKAADMVRSWGWKYPEYTQKQLYDIYRRHVEPILTAGQEAIIGSKFDTKGLDAVHYDFLRYLSGVASSSKVSTSRDALDLEFAGMVIPPEVARKIRALKYYTKLKWQKHSTTLTHATDLTRLYRNEEGTWMGAIDAILDESNQHQQDGRTIPDTSRVDLEFLLDTTEEILTNAYA